jgi:serine/threonine-protein kinase
VFVEERLATGAAGAIYGIRGPQGSGPLALKIFDLRHTERPGISLAFALQRRCAGPLIIAAHMLHMDRHRAYWAMERAFGPSLEAHLCAHAAAHRPVPLLRLLHDFATMARAVAHCHGRGVVHRDIKPDNFLLTGPDLRGLKLADFALAIDLPKAQSVGSTLYMAPEALRGAPAHGAMDVYALGICLYRMIVGLEPHYDDDEALVAAQILAQQPSYTVDDLRRALHQRGLPAPAVQAIVAWYQAATHPEARRRPPAAQLAQAAERLLVAIR